MALFSGVQQKICAQNLFDASHTTEYANHLYKAGEYASAAKEFERALSFNPNSYALKNKILLSYTKMENYMNVISMRRKLFPDSVSLNKDMSKLYISALFKTKQYNIISDFVNRNENYTVKQRAWMGINMAICVNNIDSAFTLFNANYNKDTFYFSGYNKTMYSYIHYKPKKMAIAAIMSAIVPGSGKVYTGEVKDGLINFISIATWGYLAYRGFSIRGYKSGLGYTSVVFGTGFYLGNIYGAILSAKRANENKRKQWIDNAKEIFESHN